MAEQSAAGAMSPPTGQAGSTPSAMAPPSVTFPTKSIAALSQYSARDNTKILVRFKAIGAAPIMKTNGFRITAFNKFQAVVLFLKKELGNAGAGAGAGSLFLYINNSFCPSPEDTVGNLFRCFGTDGHLIVNYSTTPAFG